MDHSQKSLFFEKGFSLLEMMLCVLLLCVFMQLLMQVTSMLFLVVKRSETVFAAQMQAENMLALMQANPLATQTGAYTAHLQKSKTLSSEAHSVLQRATLDLQQWQFENEQALKGWKTQIKSGQNTAVVMISPDQHKKIVLKARLF